MDYSIKMFVVVVISVCFLFVASTLHYHYKHKKAPAFDLCKQHNATYQESAIKEKLEFKRYTQNPNHKLIKIIVICERD